MQWASRGLPGAGRVRSRLELDLPAAAAEAAAAPHTASLAKCKGIELHKGPALPFKSSATASHKCITIILIQKVQLSNMLSNDPGPDSSPLFGRTAQLFTVFTPVGKLPRLNACPGTNDCSWDVGQGKTSWINSGAKKREKQAIKPPFRITLRCPINQRMILTSTMTTMVMV